MKVAVNVKTQININVYFRLHCFGCTKAFWCHNKSNPCEFGANFFCIKSLFHSSSKNINWNKSRKKKKMKNFNYQIIHTMRKVGGKSFWNLKTEWNKRTKVTE